MGMPPEQVFIFIIGTIIVLFGAYYVTYYVGMKASGQTRAGLRNRNIKMLDRYAISRDKQFCIIEVAGKIYIIGISNHTMTLLDTLDAAVFAELTENDEEPVPWNMTPVGQYGNKLTQKLVAFVAEKTGKTKKANFSENLKEAEQKSSEEQPKEQPEEQTEDKKKKKPSDNKLKPPEEGE